MERERARQRRRQAGERLLLVWGVALFPNLLVAVGVTPDGWAWTGLRLALGVAWAVALVVFLTAVVQEVRARRAGL